jgi:aminopeptidase N
MRKVFLTLGLGLALYSTSFAQTGEDDGPQDDGWKKVYRAFATKVNDLVHTKLDARFDYSKSYLNGKVWITLKPHFYNTDSLRLDAKGMNINKVEMVKTGGAKNVTLKYTYEDSMFLNIQLDRAYNRNEQYTVYIEYVAKPDEYRSQGSAAISDAKGLYFINPKGEEKDKPTQIWTQGETEATSVWVPTIDRPNQKTTDEIIMTVPAKYVTLSNGKLISQVKNADGTRTDHWKMDQPHAPYLFFMGVGAYAVVKDAYKGKEVSYYVEKEYEPVARKIFGNTPEMIKHFSELLGVEYPWVKYAQIVGRDYVSGAMENTTATLHQESAQQNARQLIDGNGWESTIAHELFHQWFGDYVTAESWSNLTVNESFANYSQVLWNEYKYGKDAGDEENDNDMQGYLRSGSEKKDLARFYYRDKEDMFDAVSYNKGGRILHMLRNYVGDDAFFKSLNKYLTTNKFGTGSAHKLRLAFEEVTGKDLNWYWNQWWFGAGHPKLEISYYYNDANKFVSVYVKQTQDGDKIFTMPTKIDVYQGGKKTTYDVWLKNKVDTFSFNVAGKPDLVNFDADKILLAEKKDDKTAAELAYQYRFAKKYKDRKEALDYAAKNLKDDICYNLLLDALADPYAPLRSKALTALSNLSDRKLTAATYTIVEGIAKKDADRPTRAKAIDVLGAAKDAKYKPLFIQGVNDSSYSVAGASLEALAKLDSTAALDQAKQLIKTKTKGRLSRAVSNVVIKYGDESFADFLIQSFNEQPFSDAKFTSLNTLSSFLPKVKDAAKFKAGIDAIDKFKNDVPGAYKAQITPYINNMVLKNIAAKKEKAGETELADYVKSKMK